MEKYRYNFEVLVISILLYNLVRIVYCLDNVNFIINFTFLFQENLRQKSRMKSSNGYHFLRPKNRLNEHCILSHNNGDIISLIKAE